MTDTTQQAQEKLLQATRSLLPSTIGRFATFEDAAAALDRILGYSELLQQLESWRKEYDKLVEVRDGLVQQKEELLGALKRCLPLLRLVTVHQVVIEGTDEALDASGLNPYCLNEGTAQETDTIEPYWADAAIARAKGGK